MDNSNSKALVASSIIVVSCIVYGGVCVHYPMVSTLGIFVGLGCFFLVRWAQGEF